MDKEVVKELIQTEMTAANITLELTQLLKDPAKQKQLQEDYTTLKKLLSKGGNASANAAEIIYDFVK